ncbi:MAG: hypothetical protein EZS28_007284 [Streblomastix strix]|uniref:Uncharacterized protein n=1 Tax=Streblomastix strix TaxID=222440 RepID=A0A5J4WSV6_9EUKA|nr:MAG: hypothetical protein EZS28_007284 [Streblomastix strix]
MDKMQFIEGDTDSAFWAIKGNPNDDIYSNLKLQLMIEIFIMRMLSKFPPIRGDIKEDKKILGLAIERQGTAMVALAPKNYMIETNYSAISKIKLKGVNKKTNKITKELIIDCINEGNITKCTYMRLGQMNL